MSAIISLINLQENVSLPELLLGFISLIMFNTSPAVVRLKLNSRS